MGPQSQPMEFNWLLGSWLGCSDPMDGPCDLCLPLTSALSVGRAPRPALTAAEASLEGSLPLLEVGVTDREWYWPARGLRISAAPALGLGLLVYWASLTGMDCLQCILTTCSLWPGLLPRRCSRSVANRLAPHPTRLETRTKESNMCASHWVLRNLKGTMKVKAHCWVSLGRILAPCGLGALLARLVFFVSEAEPERTRWDPKDGELCLNRLKPGETLVEDRSDSDVQIDRQIWV